MAPQIVIHPTEKPSKNDDQHSKYRLYGWKNLRIGGFLSQPLFAYVMLCICNFVQNFSVNGANNAVISTLERVFYMDSVQSGFFLSLYDLATVFSSPIVGYLGSRYSSPIFFSLNMIIVGFGNLLIASSNFINQDRLFNINTAFLQQLAAYDNVLFQCSKDPFNDYNITDVSCLKQERISSASQNAKLVLYLGNFVNGIGSVALFTIGIAYIERIFPRDKAAYCQGIYFAVGTIGGALGIVAAGRFLLIYTKITLRKRLPSWLKPSHPLWIGCWWLPYFIYGGLSIVIGLFVSGLPNYEKPGKKHPINPSTPSSIDTDNNLGIARQESSTTISMLNSRPVTPSLEQEVSTLDINTKTDTENSHPPSNSEYRLSNRRLRQLKPLEHKSSNNSLLSVKNKSEGFINRAYSSDSLYDQLPPKDTTSTTLSTVSDSTQSLPSSNTTISSISHTPTPQTVLENIKHMWFVICELMKNTRYICIIIANLFEGILIKGFVPFITKYFQYQHQLDTSTATLITGAIALISVIVACPVGAYFMNKFSWTPMQCARVCGIVFITSSFLFLFLILSCPELKFEYSSCTKSNTPCCRNVYYPVCMESNPHRMFLSPCHYGCTNQSSPANSSTTYYTSCNCASDPTVELTAAVCKFRAIPCVAIFALTVTGATFVVFFTAFVQVPMLQPLLYSVPLPYQSMALGLRQTIVRVLGQTTGPLLFGFVFDESCLVWLIDCYNRRTCAVYNNRHMGLAMALCGFSTRIISGTACMILFLNWKLKHSNEVATPTVPTTVPTANPTNTDENSDATKS